MIINPIIPIWCMVIVCIILLLLKRKGLKAFLRQSGIVLLLFMINLRPMIPSDDVEKINQKLDLNVLFVVDNTISMIARDYDNGKTERLAAVKEDCANIVEELNGANFSVISFHNRAMLAAPFTSDVDFINTTIESIHTLDSLYARGSSMNTSKEVMQEVLKKARKNEEFKTVVFYISDGEITNDDKLESFSEMAEYIDAGAVLGYGTKQGGKMYVQSYASDKPEPLQDDTVYPREDAVSVIDEGNLKKLAKDMNIEYVHMTTHTDLDEFLKNMKKEILVSKEDEKGEGYKDIYYYFVVPILGILIYEYFNYRRKG